LKRRAKFSLPLRGRESKAPQVKITLKRIIGSFTLALTLLCVVTALGQTPPQNVVLIRNVMIADGEGGASVAADVLVVSGKLSRVNAGFSPPAGTVVIDGGGNTLTLADDGQIRLTPAFAAAGTARAQGAEGLAVSFKKESSAADSEFVAPPRSSSAGVRSQVGGLHAEGSIENAQAQQTAAQSGAPQAGQPPERDLASQVVDPTAALKTLSFQNKFSPSLWGIDDEQNEVDLQLGIPHSAFGQRNILRVTVPYLTSSPSGARGLTDAAVLNILLFPKEWATIAVGAVASLGTSKGTGIDTFALGPAAGLIFKKNKWTYGVFNQNLFSFGDVATTQIQPVLAYTVNKQVSLALGDLQYTVDWKKDRFVNVPLGFQVNYITSLGEQPVRLFVNPQYNLKNEFGSRKWGITTGLTLIVK
jgi:hypothetical protein